MSTRWNGSWAAPWMGDAWDDLGMFGELRRHMAQVLDDLDRSPEAAMGRGAPSFELKDAGEALEIRAEMPGFSRENIDVQIEQRTLTIRGRREVTAPEGYVAHRRERGAMEVARAFTLPCRVDPDRTTAALKNGVLELSLAKAAEERPRRVEVRAS